MQTVLGIFRDREDVTAAIDELRERGFDAKDISIVMRDKSQAKEIHDDTGAGVAEGAVSGATTGAILGGLAGLLAATVIPGLGAFFIGGPIAASLGLTGAAASTVSGAATGAVAGGLLGALMGLGLNREDAAYYEEKINAGAILVAVPTADEEVALVRNIFDDYAADDVRAISHGDIIEGDIDRDVDLDDDFDDTRVAFEPESDLTYAVAAKGGRSVRTDETTTERPVTRRKGDARRRITRRRI